MLHNNYLQSHYVTSSHRLSDKSHSTGKERVGGRPELQVQKKI